MPHDDQRDLVRECAACRRCCPPEVERCPDCRGALTTIKPIPFIINYRYRLTRVIGRGRTGITFLALDDAGEQVAVKVIRADLLADPWAADRFRHEASLACQFHHPYVARMVDYGRLADGSGYLVSEYVTGATLRDELNRKGRLPVREAVHILADLCEALEAAHRAGLLHRDLKPEKIVLRDLPDAPDPAIRLVGFSLTPLPGKIPGQPGDQTGETAAPSNYLSPEQWAGGEADVRTEIFSVGVIGYEMLAGRLPFGRAGGSDGERGPIESPGIDPDAPPALAREILQALEIDPYQRQQRAIELKRELVNAAHLS